MTEEETVDPAIEDPKLLEMGNEINELRSENARRIQGLYTEGVPIEIGAAMAEHNLAWLERFGIIDRYQRAEIALDWERNFNKQLKAIQQKVASSRARQQLSVPLNELIGPNGSPIGSSRPKRPKR